MSRSKRAAVIVGLVALGGVTLGRAESSEEPSATRREVTWGTARELTELAAALDIRERDIERREASLTEQEAALRSVEAELTGRLEELEAERARLTELLDGLDEAEAERVVDLVRRVEAMRDTQAAAVLAETEPSLAVEVLRRMAPSKAGKALAKMNPRVAADLGERMVADAEETL